MPFASKQQAKFAHSEGGKDAGFTSKMLKEYDDETDFKNLPKKKGKKKKKMKWSMPGDK